jgi:hypothetical protein
VRHRSIRLARLAIAGGLLVGTLALDGGVARAWANGVDGPDAYGTHDWILDRALRALGDRADWVCSGVALRATDDPDTQDGIDHASGTWWHVYDVWGDRYGDAPDAAAVWFRRAASRLREGRACAASRAVGILAHLVGDIAQPMHTDGYLDAEDRVHSPYESAVDARSERGDETYAFAFDGVDPASARARTVALAKQAHRSYRALVTDYDAHGYDARVARITERQLDRAANALADLIAALSGAARRPTTTAGPPARSPDRA